MFRIVQEALTNIKRHARINQAWIELRYDPEQVFLQIRDGGVGFLIPEDFSTLHGWGLVGMRERAESIGGTFAIHSEIGLGTLLEIRAPANLTQEDLDADYSLIAR